MQVHAELQAMKAYYNDNNAYCCQWIGNLIQNELITPGTIDCRTIKDVRPSDLNGYTRCHFFAGIAGWERALQLAAWPADAPAWTASCPCQPFSCAGSQKGIADDRHLWPHFLRIIAECRPPTIFGEQVASKLGREWLAGVRDDLEVLGYAVGAADLCAAGVGAPHIRQRLYFVAHAPGLRLFGGSQNAPGVGAIVPGTGFESDWRVFHGHRISSEPGAFPLVARIPAKLGHDQPELRRLVRGARGNQRGRLRAYGNSIVPELAAEFIKAAEEGIRQMSTGQNGHGNMFRDLTLTKLKQVVWKLYTEVVRTETADAYWLLGECLHELRRRKQLSLEECVDYVCMAIGIDEIRPGYAMTIRDDHERRESIAGMTGEEAWEQARQLEEDVCEQVQQSEVENTPSSSPNGDGKQAQSPESDVTNIKGLRLLSKVKAKSTEWLWEGYIALGEVTIVEGDPATNKSSLANCLAALLTRGKKMPGAPATGRRPRKGGALFLVGEDSIDKTVRARLKAAGADLSQVAVMEDVAIPDDLPTIAKAIRAVGAKLLVIDTLNDFFACNVLSHQQVRRVLRKLRRLAERTNIAVVILRHFVKSGSGRSLFRGGGSVGITAVVRSQLKLFRHPDDPNLRVLIHDKCTLGSLSPSLMFEVVPDDGGKTFHLEWHGKCDLTIADLEQKHKGSPTLEAAETFLMDKLADGPKEVVWLVEQARGLCSKRTLDEAKKSLGVKTIREGKGQNHKVYWSL